MDKSNIKNIDDLIEFLGQDKVNQLFIEHYLKLIGKELIISDEIKNLDLLSIED